MDGLQSLNLVELYVKSSKVSWGFIPTSYNVVAVMT